MFFMTGHPQSDISEAQSDFIIQHDSSNTGRFVLNHPYRLMLISIQPDNPEHYQKLTIISPKETFFFELSTKELKQVPDGRNLHKHDFYEIMIVLDGEVYQNIENERHLYTKGSCCILNKNVRHTEEYRDYYRVAFVQISSNFLKHLYECMTLHIFGRHKTKDSKFLQFLDNNINERQTANKNYLDLISQKEHTFLVKHVHSILDQIVHITVDPTPDANIRVQGLFLDLLYNLSRPDYYNSVPIRIGTDTENRLFQQITKLLEANHGHISRKKLSDALSYSGTYLNAICKKYSGLSLFDYGMHFCMKEASIRLLDTDQTIADISRDLGFTNQTHFYKVFKEKYKMTPMQYRKQNQTKE